MFCKIRISRYFVILINDNNVSRLTNTESEANPAGPRPKSINKVICRLILALCMEAKMLYM